MEPSIEAGAAGFVGIFDAPWESCEYYVPYDGVERPIPGVWISRSDGERVETLLAGGAVTARIVVDSTRSDVTTHNTPDKVHEASMEPVTRAAIRIIASTTGVTAAQMRRGVSPG